MKRLTAALALLLSVSTTPVYAQTVEDGWRAYDAGDYEKAKSIFEPLTEAGNAKAMTAIGRMHRSGNGFSENAKLACDWYEKSAKAGYAPAQYNLGRCYFFGNGRILDKKSAIEWHTIAAEQDYVNSQIHLMKILAETNPERATFWGQKAVNQGSAVARVNMWSLDLENTGRPASHFDIGCVLLMNGLLGKKWGYCD